MVVRKNRSVHCSHCNKSVTVPVADETPQCPRCSKLLPGRPMNSTMGFVAPSSTRKKKRKISVQSPQASSEKNIGLQKISIHSEVPPDHSIPGPKTIGPYEVIKCLGKGGMGVVYEAFDPRLDRKVALKVLKAGQDAEIDVILRFRQEAEHVARLRHPNIVSIFDVGKFESQDYFTMDLIKGLTFDEWLRKERPTIRQRVRVIQKIAEAIHYAHRRSIIHRDLKPENILIDADGEPFVMDFGLARNVSVSSRFTISGMTLGTPNYMSPEQASAKNNLIGPCSDIWALGVVLYESLVGRPPFGSENVYATLMSVINDVPEPLRKLDRKIAKDLETICLKCLEKNRFKRYVTALALADDLEAWLSGDLIQARPPSILERGGRLVKAHPVLAVSCLLFWVFAIVGGWLYHDKREAELAMREHERLAPVKRAAERKRAMEIKQKKADLNANKALGFLKSARLLLAAGKKREATKLLIDAHALYTSVLHEISGHQASRDGMADVVLLQFHMTLADRNWEQAKDYLLRAAKVGLDEINLLRLRMELNNAQVAERDEVRKGVRDLMSDSILGANRKYVQVAAESKLRNLPRKLAIEELLLFVSSEFLEQQLLAISVLGGVGDLRVAKKILPYVHKVSPSGIHTEYPVQVAAFNAICQIAPQERAVFFDLQSRMKQIAEDGLYREFESDTRLFRKSYFTKMDELFVGENRAESLGLGESLGAGLPHVSGAVKETQSNSKKPSKTRDILQDDFGGNYSADEIKALIKKVDEILHDAPNDSMALLQRGLLREKKGDQEGALTDYNKAIKLDPKIIIGLLRRGDLYRKYGNFKEALSDYTKAINLKPESTSSYLRRGHVQRQIGKQDAALRDFNMAIRLSPRNAKGWNGRGGVRLKIGKYKAAIGDFTKALAILPGESSGYYNRAVAYEHLGANDKAAVGFAKAISLFPDHVKYRHQRIKFRFKIKDFVGALQDTAHSLKVDPENGMTWMLQGRVRVALGEFKEAIKEFSNAIHFAFAEDMPYQERGKLFQKMGRYLEAIADLKKATSLNGKNWKSHLYLGISLDLIGKKKEAKVSMDTAMALSPDAQEYYDSIKATLKFEVTLKVGLDSNGKHTDALKKWSLRANYKISQKNYKEAVGDLMEILKILPERASTYFLLATCHENLRDYKKASKYYREAAVRDPENASNLDRAAWFLLTCMDEELWDPKVALELAKKAVKLSERRDSTMLDTLALAWFRSNKPANAVRVQQEAIAIIGKEDNDAREGYLLKLNRYKAEVDEQAGAPEK